MINPNYASKINAPSMKLVHVTIKVSHITSVSDFNDPSLGLSCLLDQYWPPEGDMRKQPLTGWKLSAYSIPGEYVFVVNSGIVL